MPDVFQDLPMLRTGRVYALFVVFLICAGVVGGLVMLWRARPANEVAHKSPDHPT
jgi:hypothetical protein